MAPSCHHCSHGCATLVSFIVDLYLSVNNTEVFSVAVEMLELVFFALLSSFKIFCTAVNNINVRKSSCKVPDIFCPILSKFGFPGQIFIDVPSIKVHGNPSSGCRVGKMDGETERGRRRDITKIINAFHCLRAFAQKLQY